MADEPLASDDLDRLATEGRLAAAFELDRLPTRQQVALLASQDRIAVEAVEVAGEAIAVAVELVADRLAEGGRLIYVGAGTSGRLAMLDAAECGPTFGLDADRVMAVLAGGAHAFGSAREGDEDDADAGHDDLAAVEPRASDAIVGVAASGRTPYVLGALSVARSVGAATVAVVNSPASPMAARADHTIEVLTGPEVVAGSTRLKAGTAQKLVLNAISTLSMVKLGRTLGDLMVEVDASNDKLRRRVLRTVVAATGEDEAAAAEALRAAGGQAKVAIVTLLCDYDVDRAVQALRAADGHVRRVVDAAR